MTSADSPNAAGGSLAKRNRKAAIAAALSTVVDAGASKITDVATGHTVHIVATGSDSATATVILDSNLMAGTGQTGTQGGPGGAADGNAPNGAAQGGSGQAGTGN